MKARDIPEATEAADPSTSPERLGNIADLYPELHPILVLNPSCPEDLREWMRSVTPKANEKWEDHLAAERARQQAEAQQRAEAQRQATSSQTTLQRQSSSASSSKPQTQLGRWLVIGIAVIGIAVVIRTCGQSLEHSTSSHTRTSSTPTASVSPAPSNAVSASRFQSPSQNISCEIDDNRAACSIYARDYGDAGLEDCDEVYFSMTVQDSTSLACGSEFATDGTAMTLDYGESVKSGAFACTSADDGVRCWNQQNGHGFKIARAGYSTF